MADTTTTLRLKAVDDGAIATVNNVSNAFTGLTIGTTALAVGFTGLRKASESSVGQFILGAQNAEKFSGAIAKLADVNSKALKTFSAISDITFLGGQALTLVKGVQDAAAVYARIPQTFDLFRSSGVSTQSIEDFYTLTDAVKGSEASLDSFAVSAVQNLGRFEQAAARAGTILRSNTNFDNFGSALRANQQEQLENAFQVQDIVNKQLNNTVTSTNALVGQYEVLSSGFTKAADSQQVLTSGLKLIGIGEAGGNTANPTDTLQLLTKTLNAYELGASESAKTSAILNGIVENGLTTIQELSLGFGQTAKTAKAANVALVDLAAGTSVLTAQGVNTSNALTGLQRVFGSIISKTPEAEKALSKLSLNGQKIRFDLAEIQAKGFTQALLDLNKAAGGNAQILQEVFPEEVAFRTVLALLAQDGQKLANVTSSIGSITANSLDEVFKIATGDRVNKFQQIANKFQELIIKVAASVAPVFEPGIAVLEKIANFFSNLPEPVKQAIGQFIVFQISARATASAVGILFQTLLNLASSYLQVRLISLALSGQLGKEIGVIRELITQRKGLAAVGLQLFGIDQRFRLGVQATTEALEKQNIITKAIAGTRKAVALVKNTGGEIGELVDKGKNIAGNVITSAKNVGLGVAEAIGVVSTPQILGSDGKPISGTGLDRVKGEAAKVGGAIASGFKESTQNLGDVLPRVEILGSDGKPLSTEKLKQQAQAATETIKAEVQKGSQALQQFKSKGQFEFITADNTSFLAKDKQFRDAQKQFDSALDRELIAQKEFQIAGKQLEKSREDASKKAFAADQARVKALEDSSLNAEQKQKAITRAIEARVKAEEAADVVGQNRDEFIARERELQQLRGERIDKQLELDKIEEEASVKYAQATERQTLARRFNAQAIKLEEKAILAKTKADELEAIAALSPSDIAAQTKAKQARAAATALEEKAAQFKARAEAEVALATQLATKANLTALLAEQGLAQARIFGTTVTFSTQGVLGAVNKLLATEITLKTVATGATRGLAVSQGVLTAATSLLGTGLSFSIAGLKALGAAAAGVATEGTAALVGSLGLLAPVLAVGVLAVGAFKDDLFGLGKASREAASGLQEVLKQDADLDKKFGSEQRLLQFKAELKTDDSAANVETRLEQLRLSGDLTTGQFNQLRETLARTGEQGQLTAKGLEEFKTQLEAIRQGATGTPEQGVGDRIGGFFGGLGRGILNLPNYLAEAATANLGFRSSQDIAREREADRLVGNNSQIAIALGVVGDQSLATAQKIGQYQKALGLTAQTNEKLVKGTKLTAEDLERENQIFNAQKSRNENLISGIEKNIAEQRKVAQSINDPELKAQFEAQINQLEQERKTLESRNEALKSGREEFTKYYTELLPGLKRAITESTNLQQALGNAQSNFQQQFKLDAKGNATPFLKDISTLRTEAGQLQSQILEAYQGGIFEQLAGSTLPGQTLTAPTGLAEARVIEQLKAVRDNKITLPDGTIGFRLSQSDRLAATQQIVEIGQSSSKQISESLKLSAEEVKLAQQQRIISTEDAEKQIAQIQLKGIQEALIQKEIEIKEYAQFPIRKAQLEREAAAIRVQIEQAITSEENRQLERRRNLRQEAFNVEIEQIKANQSERIVTEQQAQAQIAQIQITASRDRLSNLVEDFNKSGGTSVELANKIAIARAQLRQQEAAEIERVFNLEQQRQKQIIANTTQLQTLTLQGRGQRAEGRGKDIELQQQFLNSTFQLQSILNQTTEAGLQNQLKFTGDLEKRAAIETQIAENRVSNLAITQQQERVSLTIQTQLNKLNLERESIQLRIQKIENQRQIAELNLEMVRAKRDRRTPEEIKAIELQIQGAQQQSELLDEQGDRLERSKVQQAQITENSLRELEIKQGIARVDANIELTLTRRRQLQAQVETQVKNIELASQQINLAGQIQIQQSEAVSKVYDQQKTILQASQTFLKGRADFVTGELQLTSELTKNERQKKDIAQLIAAIKLQSLETQLAMEEQVLDLNLAQQAAQLEQEKIRNRVSQAQANAGVAQAQADLAKTQLDPNATPQAIQAAQLNLQAKIEESIATSFAGTLLGQQGQIQSTLGNLERQSLRERSLLQRDQAQVEFAQTLSPGRGRRLLRDIRDRSFSRALGVGKDEVISAGSAFVRATESQFFGDGNLEPLDAFRAGAVSNRINPQTPSLQLQFPNFEEFRNNQLARFQEFGYKLPNKLSSQDLNTLGQAAIVEAVEKLNALVEQKLSTPNEANVPVSITNNFNGDEAKKAANQTVNDIRKELYDLGVLLNR